MSTASETWLADWNEGDQIGSGGQGVVIELQSKCDPSKRAVLKRLTERWRGNNQAKDRMVREIEAMQTLNKIGAKVPKILGSFLDHDEVEPYFIMEFIPGILFKDWLEQNAPTSIETALLITKAVAETIELCHSQLIGHRDLKPANIILRNGDPASPFVLDFGISFDSMQSMIVTKEGEVFWNEFITLPECQDRLGGHQDLRSDLTALAGIFFNCIVGESPAVLVDANGMPPQRRFFSKLQDTARDSSELMRLKTFFDTAFAVAIGQRFQTLPDFRGQLTQFEINGVDTESLLDVSQTYLGNLLEHDRGAQLTSLRGPAGLMCQKIKNKFAERIKSESLREFALQNIDSNLTSVLSDFPTGFPQSVMAGDRLLPNTIGIQILVSNKHPRVPACAIIPVAVGMRIHVIVGGWITPNKQSANKPTGGIDWVDAGSLAIDYDGAEENALVDAATATAYEQLKNQLRKMTMMVAS